ncbi:MAG: cold shock domain-containing protein [Candidatus Nanohaloarchaea archaeon]|nr:cold shock domain-containing protein [Candidatus Nanohaloarchaea archaeon]
MQGTVKFFHDMKNYGFIKPEDGEEDVFFHVEDLEAESVSEGDRVEFERTEGDRGPRAENVKEA